MGQEECRYTLRLYRDKPDDAEAIRKMEELLSTKVFRNRNELFRRGIELAYNESCGKLGNNLQGHYQKDRAVKEVLDMILEEVRNLQASEGPYVKNTNGRKMTEEMSAFLAGLNDG